MSTGPGTEAAGYYLAEKLARAGPDFPLAEAFCLPRRRAMFRGLFALKVEFEELLAARREPDLAMPRASWWQEEWTRLVGGVPRHPLTCELAGLGVREAPGLEPVLAHFAAAQSATGEASVAEFLAPARALGQLLGGLEAGLLGSADDATRSAVWEDVVSGDQLLALPERLRREQADLPLELGAELQLNRRAVLADAAAMERLLSALVARRDRRARRPAPGGDAWVYLELVELRLRRRETRRGGPRPLQRLRRAWAGARQVRRGQ